MTAKQCIIPEHEFDITAIRAQGAGGQNVNKVSSAIHLRFDIARSSLPDWVKQRLLNSDDQRITRQGVLVLKAQLHRSQERNRAAAIERLHEIVEKASHVDLPRYATRPGAAVRARRRDDKTRRATTKALRSKVL